MKQEEKLLLGNQQARVARRIYAIKKRTGHVWYEIRISYWACNGDPSHIVKQIFKVAGLKKQEPNPYPPKSLFSKPLNTGDIGFWAPEEILEQLRSVSGVENVTVFR